MNFSMLSLKGWICSSKDNLQTFSASVSQAANESNMLIRMIPFIRHKLILPVFTFTDPMKPDLGSSKPLEQDVILFASVNHNTLYYTDISFGLA